MIYRLNNINFNELYEEAARRITEKEKRLFPNQPNTTITADDLDLYAFPQTFCNTIGPHGGIGGSTLTRFTVLAFTHEVTGSFALWCDGKWRVGEKLGSFSREIPIYLKF